MTAKKSTVRTSNKYVDNISKETRNIDNSDNACKVYDRTRESVNHFFDVYSNLGVGVQGAPSHTRQDLLRAMIVFSSSGVDSFLKQLIKDVLPEKINENRDAQKMFATFVEKQIKQEDKKNKRDINSVEQLSGVKLIASAIAAKDTREFLLKKYQDDLINGSLQSLSEVMRISSAFAIKSEDLFTKTEINVLKDVFKTRNEIIHEMDIDFAKSGSGSNTKKRQQTEVIKQCKALFAIMEKIIEKLI